MIHSIDSITFEYEFGIVKINPEMKLLKVRNVGRQN